MIKHKHIGLATLAAAVSLVIGGVAGATSATAETVSQRIVTSATGSRQCGPGLSLYVRATLATPGTVNFYRGTTLIHSATASFHYYTYPNSAGKTTSWKITSTTNIDQVSDGCA